VAAGVIFSASASVASRRKRSERLIGEQNPQGFCATHRQDGRANAKHLTFRKAKSAEGAWGQTPPTSGKRQRAMPGRLPCSQD